MYSYIYKMRSNTTINAVLQKLGAVTTAYRDKEGITQEALAERINISRLTVINIEKGKGSNSINVLKILQYFDLLHDLDVSLELMLEKAQDRGGISEINLYE